MTNYWPSEWLSHCYGYCRRSCCHCNWRRLPNERVKFLRQILRHTQSDRYEDYSHVFPSHLLSSRSHVDGTARMAAMKQDQHQHQKQRKQRPQNLNMQDQQAEEIKQRMEAKRCHNKTSVTTTTTAKKEPSSTTAPNKGKSPNRKRIELFYMLLFILITGAILFAQASQQAELHQKAGKWLN